jgi:hypothetical protein
VRARVLALAVVAALAAAYLWRDSGSGASDAPVAAPRAPAAPPLAAQPPSAAAPAPLRNVFEYADAPRPAAPESAPTAAPVTAPVPSPSPAVRLVGLVRRNGQLKAALAVLGETVVLARGESAAGYTVLSIDEEDGVRVQAPDGGVLRLAPDAQ